MKITTITIIFLCAYMTLFAQLTPVKKTTIPVVQRQTQIADTVKRQVAPARQKSAVINRANVLNRNEDRPKKNAEQTEQQTNPDAVVPEESPEQSSPTEPVNTLVTGTFTDSRDGNTYTWVEIGDQTWMSQNMAYLPQITPADSGSLRQPCYYVYDFRNSDISAAKAAENYQKYGVLYNWNASLNACPAGWHLPTDAEWKQLEKHLGMTDAIIETPNWRGEPIGSMLKSANGWNDAGNGNGGTNESGFTAMPGGLWSTYNGGSFNNLGIMGFYWTSTNLPKQSATDIPMHAWYRSLTYAMKKVNYYVNPMSFGKSVRCVKD